MNTKITLGLFGIVFIIYIVINYKMTKEHERRLNELELKEGSEKKNPSPPCLNRFFNRL